MEKMGKVPRRNDSKKEKRNFHPQEADSTSDKIYIKANVHIAIKSCTM